MPALLTATRKAAGATLFALAGAALVACASTAPTRPYPDVGDPASSAAPEASYRMPPNPLDAPVPDPSAAPAPSGAPHHGHHHHHHGAPR